jgi:predicted metallopeptidase
MASSAAAERSLQLDGFDFTFHAQRLCADLCQRLDELRHVDMGRVAIRYCQVRKAVSHGMQASLTPLRFEHGSLFTMRAGRRWTMQRVYGPVGQEMLYLLSFYLPRFLNQSFHEKLATVVHELWHISPEFNGDIRRLPGRCYAHGHSEEHYHASMHELARRWLALDPPEELHSFLRCDFADLRSRHGAIYGVRIRTPRLIPAEPPAS